MWFIIYSLTHEHVILSILHDQLHTDGLQSTEHQYLKYIIEEMWKSQKLTFCFFYSIYLKSLNIGYIPVSCDSSAFNYCSKDWLKYQVHWTESTGSSSTSIETTSFKKSYTTQYLESVWSPIRTYINIFSFMCNNMGLSNYEYSQVTVNAHGPLVTKTSESLMIQHEI